MQASFKLEIFSGTCWTFVAFNLSTNVNIWWAGRLNYLFCVPHSKTSFTSQVLLYNNKKIKTLSLLMYFYNDLNFLLLLLLCNYNCYICYNAIMYLFKTKTFIHCLYTRPLISLDIAVNGRYTFLQVCKGLAFLWLLERK